MSNYKTTTDATWVYKYDLSGTSTPTVNASTIIDNNGTFFDSALQNGTYTYEITDHTIYNSPFNNNKFLGNLYIEDDKIFVLVKDEAILLSSIKDANKNLVKNMLALIAKKKLNEK